MFFTQRVGHIWLVVAKTVFWQLFCVCQVTISLRDVNDRTPVFQFHDYQSEISEDSPVGTTITTLLATDMDAAENTAVRFFLIAVSASKTTGSSILISPFFSLKSARKQVCLVRANEHGLGNSGYPFDFRYFRLITWLMQLKYWAFWEM